MTTAVHTGVDGGLWVHRAWRALGCLVATLTAVFGLASCGGGGGTGGDNNPPPGSSNWRALASLGTPRQEAGVALLNNEIYFVGGFARGTPSAMVEAYSPASDRWRTVASLPFALHHPNVAAVGGKLYVAGALVHADFIETGATLEYDPATDQWRSRTSMPAGSARGAAATAAIGGRVYLAGGFRGGQAVNLASVYDPALDQWGELAAMPTARDHLVGAEVSGRLYAIGGRNGNVLRAQVEIFDPSTGQWTTGAPMPTARGGCMGAAVGGRIVVVGGEGNANSSSGVFDDSELYDPTSNTWQTLERMRAPRHGTGAAGLDGSLYVPGGADREGFGAVITHDALQL